MSFSAVILAGGKSLRMGCDKAFLEISGRALLARQIGIVRDAGAVEVFISGRAETDYSRFGCQVLMDQFPRCGPLAGIERALATGASPLLLVLAVDLPRLTADFLRELAAKASQGYGIIPRIAGQVEPLAAFYPRTAHSLAVEHLQTGKLAAREFAAASVAAKLAVFADFPAATTELFQNCNVPADLPMTCNPV